MNCNEFFPPINQSLEQPVAASCSLVRSSRFGGKPDRLPPFGSSDRTREMINLPRRHLAEAGASQNAVSPPAAPVSGSPGERRRRARLRDERRPLLPETWFPGPDAGLARRAVARARSSRPSSERIRPDERCPACSRLGGRTSLRKLFRS